MKEQSERNAKVLRHQTAAGDITDFSISMVPRSHLCPDDADKTNKQTKN